MENLRTFADRAYTARICAQSDIVDSFLGHGWPVVDVYRRSSRSWVRVARTFEKAAWAEARAALALGVPEQEVANAVSGLRQGWLSK